MIPGIRIAGWRKNNMILDPSELGVKDNYKLIIGSVLPRPIALVSTMSKSGVANLAPFSFFTAITSKPPTICFAPALKGSQGIKKDTLSNIEETGEFVVNVVSEQIAEQMNETAGDFPPEIDEFTHADLTPEPSHIVAVPRVKESPINLECKLYKIVYIGEPGPGSGALVIGEIVRYHIADELFRDGKIDTGLLKPVGRLAGMEYTTLGKRFILERKKI
jgi:flavin reductase (DIM6/NTAB) family NADH-FMN oxidoreductase RutF